MTHAPHVDHVGAKVARGGPLCVSETPGVHHMRDLARSQLSESLSALCQAWLLPPVGLGTIQGAPALGNFS